MNQLRFIKKRVRVTGKGIGRSALDAFLPELKKAEYTEYTV
jgi:hypothetical protein